MNNFQAENNIVFKNLIEKGLFSQLNSSFILELYITPNCNKKCTYCYLQKNKDYIYPKELRDEELILNNLEILLDYYLKINWVPHRLDLFSGEIWGYQFGNKVLDIILKYVEKGLKFADILIPSNGSFCEHKEIIEIINDYISKFALAGTNLKFSISYDGMIVDELQRPYFKGKSKDDFILNVFTFCRQHKFGFHPMIDASYIEKQEENYQSWIKLLKEYYPTDFDFTYGQVMQLEVRSNDWTEDKILSYLKWLKYYINTDLQEYYNNNKMRFYKAIIFDDRESYINCNWTSYFPYIISSTNGALLGCSLGQMLCVRLGDLAICPCHRTSYESFILGKYIVKDNEIIDLECNNLALTSSIYMTSFNTKPVCGNCAIRKHCSRNCLGANYEINNELFYPIEENCELQKAKIIFLFHYYKQLFENKDLDSLENVYNNLKISEPEVCEKWTKLIQKNYLNRLQ